MSGEAIANHLSHGMLANDNNRPQTFEASPARWAEAHEVDVIHGTWLPGDSAHYHNLGRFVLWAETDRAADVSSRAHPFHLNRSELLDRFDALALELVAPAANGDEHSLWVSLPSDATGPLASTAMARFRDEDARVAQRWASWCVDGVTLRDPVAGLKALRLLAATPLDSVILGHDLLFWCQYTRVLGRLVARHHYAPALIRQANTGESETHAAVVWDWIGGAYPELVSSYAKAMPWIGQTVSTHAPNRRQSLRRIEPGALLRHYSEQVLNGILQATAFTEAQRKRVAGTLLDAALNSKTVVLDESTWQQWQIWRTRLSPVHTDDPFTLGFRLEAPPAQTPDAWVLHWEVVAKNDPSLQRPLAEYWALNDAGRETFEAQFGVDFERRLLVQLGQAARAVPTLWRGMNGTRPSGVTLDREAAFAFLKGDAWVLEEAGFQVSLPAWWTPKGRRRAALRLRTRSTSNAPAGETDGALGLASLVTCDYELAVGGERISEKQWRALVEAKAPLVHFRGEWVALDREEMGRLLAFWDTHSHTSHSLSVAELVQRALGSEEGAKEEIALDHARAQMLERLKDKARIGLTPIPPTLKTTLRDYQHRGVAWIDFLERLGLGACLADDMGLGKTLQVITVLLNERVGELEPPPPTLLIAPTSVLGSWERELARFAPSLTALTHHGGERCKTSKAFDVALERFDIVLTSFALARRDAKLLGRRTWHRVVVDEAQNIKNPRAAQTQAIVSLKATHRIALTGTPIENRLLDLWSILRFTNPGYLGTAAGFRKNYETPIRKNDDTACRARLKRLVEPFILRRMKTDRDIIRDLPEKVEQTVYCHLTQEQASLYAAVVEEVKTALVDADGIARKGLILATLTRLKQICNHPAQFLADGSAFSDNRSHKLARVSAMADEVIAANESLLLFTQYTEMGEALATHFKRTRHYTTYYLHGGVSRTQRERMVNAFQAPDSGPAIFVLSIKAGGVGITLTRANHVFHFDRWWNPAVENQATDRAFRIGQTRRVFVHKLVSLGTVEERIDEMLKEKQRLAESIVGSDEAWLAELDNTAFAQLIALSSNATLA